MAESMARQSEEEIHRLFLEKKCRLCGGDVEKRKSSVRKFEKELHEIFRININTDVPSVHPTRICSKHTSLMNTYKRSMADSKQFSTSFSPIEFSPHTQSCMCINIQTPDERTCQPPLKKKKVSRGPGRGNFGSTVIEPDTETVKKHRSYKVSCMLQEFKYLEGNERKIFLSEVLNTLTAEEKSEVCEELGMCIAKEIEQDDMLGNMYKDAEELRTLTPEHFFPKYPLLLSLLCGICNVGRSTLHACSQKLLVQIVFIIELIVRLVKNSFIGPFSFLLNLIAFSIHNSKLACNMLGSITPSGKYDCITSWLKRQGTEAPVCPAGDVMFMFDNEQIMKKTWNISPNISTPTSVVTNVAVARLTHETVIEQRQDLHPKNWYSPVCKEETVWKLIHGKSKSEVDDLISIHYEQLYLFLQLTLKQVQDSQSHSGNGLSDDVDEAIKLAAIKKQIKICLSCGEKMNISQRKCPSCNQNYKQLKQQQLSLTSSCPKHDEKSKVQKMKRVSFIPSNNSVTPDFDECQTKNTIKEERYVHIQSNHPTDKKIDVAIMDPVYCNPNSTTSILKVLRRIGIDAGIDRYGGKERRFVPVCMDGLPYSIVLKIINEYLCCDICKKGFLGEGSLKDHCQQSHPEVEDIAYFREFDWVIPKVGDGHYEMNLFKSFMELNWQVYMEELVKCLGWTSEKAKECAKKCYDNHKSWQLLLVFHEGSMMELVLPYVRQCIENGNNLTPEGFISYAKHQEDQNFLYLFETVCRYSQGIINLRMGVRRNNSQLIESAKFMTRCLFHGRSHSKYQEIEIMDSYFKLVMPSELKDFLDNHETMSHSGNQSMGQGYDFILEEVNKNVKHWARPGKANDSMWENICRNAGKLNSLRSTFMQLIDAEDAHSSYRIPKLEKCVELWRMKMRESHHIANHHVHTNLQSEVLDHSLINFTEESERKRSYRALHLLLGQDLPDSSVAHPVYVTQQERVHYNDVNNQSIKTIDRMITQSIEKIEDSSLANVYTERLSHLIKKRIKKAEHLELLNDLNSFLDLETSQAKQLRNNSTAATDN